MRRIMWALGGFSLSSVTRKFSSLSTASTATSSVYSTGGMGAYKDAKEVSANRGGGCSGKKNARQLSMETVFEEVFDDKRTESARIRF